MSPTVTVCRDCCCGSSTKHPDTEHNGQLAILRASGVLVRVSECLDVCEHSNVMVVHRRRRVWLGGIHDPETTKWVGAWAVSGGPIPDALRPFVIERPRKDQAVKKSDAQG
jgi:(2Fe-2S) ferredoxin